MCLKTFSDKLINSIFDLVLTFSAHIRIYNKPLVLYSTLPLTHLFRGQRFTGCSLWNEILCDERSFLSFLDLSRSLEGLSNARHVTLSFFSFSRSSFCRPFSNAVEQHRSSTLLPLSLSDSRSIEQLGDDNISSVAKRPRTAISSESALSIVK